MTDRKTGGPSLPAGKRGAAGGDDGAKRVEINKTTPAIRSQSGTAAPLSRELNLDGQRVIVAANRADEEPGRLDRLERLARRAIAQGLLLSHLYEHKGILSASSKMPVSDSLVSDLSALWESENEYQLGGLYYGGRLERGAGDPSFAFYLPRPPHDWAADIRAAVDDTPDCGCDCCTAWKRYIAERYGDEDE